MTNKQQHQAMLEAASQDLIKYRERIEHERTVETFSVVLGYFLGKGQDFSQAFFNAVELYYKYWKMP